MCGFCNVWVFWQLCWCFDNMCTCIFCVLYCLHCVFVLFPLCIFILICFVCTSVRTTATEWQHNCSSNNNNNNNNNNPTILRDMLSGTYSLDMYTVNKQINDWLGSRCLSPHRQPHFSTPCRKSVDTSAAVNAWNIKLHTHSIINPASDSTSSLQPIILKNRFLVAVTPLRSSSQ